MDLPSKLVSNLVLKNSCTPYHFWTQWLVKHCQCCGLQTQLYRQETLGYDHHWPESGFYCHQEQSSSFQSKLHLQVHLIQSIYFLLKKIQFIGVSVLENKIFSDFSLFTPIQKFTLIHTHN